MLLAYDGSDLAAHAIAEAGPARGPVLGGGRTPHSGRAPHGECRGGVRVGAADVVFIVLGSRRRSGLRGHLLGSVATSVSAHAPVPVPLVPPPSEVSPARAGTRAVTVATPTGG